MKKLYLRVIPFLLITLFVQFTFAQTKGVVQKQILDKNGHPALVQFNKTDAFYAHEAQELFKELLPLNPQEKYQPVKTFDDGLGMTHQKFQQTYKGFNVEYGTYTIHTKNGEVLAVSGEYKNIDGVDLAINLSEADALEKALDFVGAKKYMWEDEGNEIWLKNEKKSANATWYPKAEMVICENFFAQTKEDDMTPSLTYKFDVYAMDPVSRAYIYVDAATGKIINTNAIIKTAVSNGTAETRYSGTQSITTDSYSGAYRLRDYSRGNGIITYDMNEGTNYNSAVDFTDNDNNWTYSEYHNADKDDAATEAHWAFQEIYDYWLEVHDRNSFDGNGALMKAYVHYDNAYDNAYWNGSVFTFGDGSDTYFDALTCLDVSAHEHGHAICSYTADLAYQNESGALNEAFSDIWGAAVEAYAAPNKDVWIMGEDIERRSGHDGLRILSDPKAEGLPDTYNGDNWAALSSSPSQYNDYGGVHTNNGPLCYWFYLISEGGSGTNDNNDSYTVSAIGMSKAEKIAWRMESVYLSSNSDYSDARTYAIQSAEDLYGAGSDEVIAVTNAMYAIGVGDPYGGGTPEYCASQGNNSSYEWIEEVTIGSFTNSSGAAGYTDFTNQTITLAAGGSYNISLTPGFGSSTYNEYWKIWIDYNGDLDFNDAGELVFDAGSMSKTTVTGTINIDAGATGQTVMRITMKYNGEPTACESFSYGEVEDYTVSFTSGGGDTQAPTAPSNLTASNVTETTVDLSWDASTDNVGVSEYIVYQGASELGTTTNTNAQITGLTEGTAYTFSVKARDDAGNTSASSNTVNVTTQSAVDTEVPSAPANLSYSSVAQTSLNLSWSAASDNVGVDHYIVYKDGAQLKTTTSTSTTITGLTASTAYSFYVKAQDAAGNTSVASNTVNVTTASDNITYCSTEGSNSSYEWIDLVELGSMSNATGNDGGYADYTNKTATVSIGDNTIYVSCGFSSSSYTEYWHVWIDLNHDGTFSDTERLVYGSSSSSNKLSATLSIPSSAMLGQTRMRVTMKYNGAATSCETFSYGEVEDYTVNIVSSSYNLLAGNNNKQAEQMGEPAEDFKIYPSPANDLVTLQFSSSRNVDVLIYDISGKVVHAQSVNGLVEDMDIEHLESGIYTVVMRDERKKVTAKLVKQ